VAQQDKQAPEPLISLQVMHSRLRQKDEIHCNFDGDKSKGTNKTPLLLRKILAVEQISALIRSVAFVQAVVLDDRLIW